jgi:hypothetical protein
MQFVASVSTTSTPSRPALAWVGVLLAAAQFSV